MAFERFNVTGLYIQDQATLALYAMGKLSGCVVDLGHGKLDVTTVHDGSIALGSSHRLPHFGGASLSKALRDLMRGQMTLPSSQTVAHDPAADWLKEQCASACLSSVDYDRAMSAGASSSSSSDSHKSYKLPDGQDITVSTEGLQLAESLFRPEISILPHLSSSGPSLQVPNPEPSNLNPQP